MSNTDDLNLPESDGIPEGIFAGLDKENPLGKETFNDILGVKPDDTPKPRFVPPTQPKISRTNEAEEISKQVSAQQTPEKEALTAEERIEALEKMIMKLREGMGDIRVVAPGPKRVVDFSKLSEGDVYDLDIPIETIEHYVPDYTKIDLKDPNYIARWVSTHVARLGPMKQAGFTYITEEDLAAPLEMDIKPDENGVYRYIDVVAMKTPKDKYFRALRTNYLRAMAQTQQKKVHQLAQQVTENALMSGTTQEKAPLGQATEYQKRKAAGQLNIYSPNL